MGSPGALDTQIPVGWPRRLARTTPGVVGLIAIVVAASCLLTGLVCGAELDARIAKTRAILDRSEPFAYASQNLYAALSAADAAAASEYLSGNETAPVRARYQQALADAASALTDVTAGATSRGDPNRSGEPDGTTGRVHRDGRWAHNNRNGFVVGSELPAGGVIAVRDHHAARSEGHLHR